MTGSALLPERLLRGLVRIDDPLLLRRYREVLLHIGAPEPRVERLHLDAAGWSPEIALAANDPYYLGDRTLDSHAIWITAAQAKAALVHPGLGFAAEAWRSLVSAHGEVLAALSLREPVLAHLRHSGSVPAGPRDLADLEAFDLTLSTPGGLLREVREIERRKQAFLASDRLWLDDAWLDDLRQRARRTRGLPALPESLLGARHRLGACYSPAFGGTYLLAAPDRRGRAATHVLSGFAEKRAGGEPKRTRTREVLERLRGGAPRTKRYRMIRTARGQTVVEQPLEAGVAVELLQRTRLAVFDEAALRRAPASLARIQQWLVLDHLRRKTEGVPDGDADPAREYLELEDTLRRLKAGKSLRFDALAPITQLRLLTPHGDDAHLRRWVGHLRAFLDPLDLGRAWQAAPDLFFARLPHLSADQRSWFAQWLDDDA